MPGTILIMATVLHLGQMGDLGVAVVGPPPKVDPMVEMDLEREAELGKAQQRENLANPQTHYILAEAAEQLRMGLQQGPLLRLEVAEAVAPAWRYGAHQLRAAMPHSMAVAAARLLRMQAMSHPPVIQRYRETAIKVWHLYAGIWGDNMNVAIIDGNKIVNVIIAPDGDDPEKYGGVFLPSGLWIGNFLPPTTDERLEKLEAENKLLREQVSAQADQAEFYEECIAEMAAIVYA